MLWHSNNFKLIRVDRTDLPHYSRLLLSNAMGPLQVSSSLSRVEPPINISGWCYGVCFLLSGSDVVAVYNNGGSAIMVCTAANLWRAYSC